jgi:hypothetical protein
VSDKRLKALVIGWAMILLVLLPLVSYLLTLLVGGRQG